MPGLAERARTRFVPALLTALGVTMLAAGLLDYATPVTAESLPPASPDASVAIATPMPRITLPPLESLRPSASPSAPADRRATRVRVRALKIDLPVVPPGRDKDYPLCDVAQWIGALGQPGQGRATYLYGHARDGMFLPMLEASLTKKGREKMRGMIVEVWTSDDQRFLYEIVEVRQHQLNLDDASAATTEELWLQTSEGPKGTPGKLQIVALPLSQEASDHASAHPKAKPVVCS